MPGRVNESRMRKDDYDIEVGKHLRNDSGNSIKIGWGIIIMFIQNYCILIAEIKLHYVNIPVPMKPLQ